MELKRQQFSETQRLETRHLACTEEESKCRVQFLRAQAKREEALARKEEIQLKVELARSLKRLRDEGVPQTEIDMLLPFDC